jgi:hypothetical protein
MKQKNPLVDLKASSLQLRRKSRALGKQTKMHGKAGRKTIGKILLG